MLNNNSLNQNPGPRNSSNLWLVRLAEIALVISALLSGLNTSSSLKWSISILFIVSGYSFVWALMLGPFVGHRGLSSSGPTSAKLVYTGNILGAVTSLLGTLVLLYAAWINL